MQLRIVSLPSLFRPSTSHVYPPFKQGRYMEEYIYEYLTKHQEHISTNWVYLPIYWTNLQNHPAFSRMKTRYQIVLTTALQVYPRDTQFFTCVQHDDGPQLPLPPSTIVFGACTGDRILPLIYEDTTERLLQTPYIPWMDRNLLASFVGTISTHPIRREIHDQLHDKKGVYFHSRGTWSAHVPQDDATQFIEITRHSRFCLAPRGYGRSSFRFFEAMLLDVVPVYVWDDIEWLPYKDELDYSKFSISVSSQDLPYLYERLATVSEEEYGKMIEEIRRVRSYFTLEGMCQWLERQITN